MAVRSVNHKEHMSTGRTQYSDLFNVHVDGTYSKHFALIFFTKFCEQYPLLPMRFNRDIYKR
jgi:hypothetical protein